MIRKGLILAAALAATAAFLPATGGAATFRGIVVAKQHGSLLVATPAGILQAVRGHAALGARVAVSGHDIAVAGRARSAVIRGIVVRRIGTTLVLASNRHLVAIRHASGLADTAPAPTAPAPGSVVSTTVGIRNGELEEENEDEIGQVNASSIQVQATVASVGAGTVTLTVQGQTLTVPLPAGLTLPASIVGQTVALSLSLAGQNQQADDDQGDDDNGGDHHGGDGGGDG
jgi:hypothetical protein